MRADRNEHARPGLSGPKDYRPKPLEIDDAYTFLDRGWWFRTATRLFRRFAYGLLRVYNRLFFGLRVSGRENLRGIEGGAVTVCNHVNLLDCTFVACQCGKKTPFFPTLKANLEIPFIRRLVEYLGGFPIPETPRAFRGFSLKVEQMLRDGEWIHLFPEGELIPYCPTLRDFKRGAFHYACRCSVPVIPFVVTYRENTGLRLLRRHPAMDLTILPPLYPRPGTDRDESQRLMEECRRRMQECIDAASGKHRTPRELPSPYQEEDERAEAVS